MCKPNHSAQLDAYLNSMPHDTYVRQCAALCEHLSITPAILYNLRKGRTHLRKAYRDSIELFFNRKIFTT